MFIEHKQVWRYQGGNQKPEIEGHTILNLQCHCVAKKKKRKERPGVKPLLTTDWATRTPLKTGVNSDTPQSSMYENDLMCNKILLCMLQFHSASICSLTWLWNAHYLYCGRCSFHFWIVEWSFHLSIYCNWQAYMLHSVRLFLFSFFRRSFYNSSLGLLLIETYFRLSFKLMIVFNISE